MALIVEIFHSEHGVLIGSDIGQKSIKRARDILKGDDLNKNLDAFLQNPISQTLQYFLKSVDGSLKL
jgi:hypothetical protein